MYVSLYLGNRVAKDDSSVKEPLISELRKWTSLEEWLDDKLVERGVVVPGLVLAVLLLFSDLGRLAFHDILDLIKTNKQMTHISQRDLESLEI